VFALGNKKIANRLQLKKDDWLLVSSAFWARIRPETFLKVRPNRPDFLFCFKLYANKYIVFWQRWDYVPFNSLQSSAYHSKYNWFKLTSLFSFWRLLLDFPYQENSSKCTWFSNQSQLCDVSFYSNSNVSIRHIEKNGKS